MIYSRKPKQTDYFICQSNFSKLGVCYSITIMVNDDSLILNYIIQWFNHERVKRKHNIPVTPLVTRPQFTALGCTELRSSRKNIPSDKLLS